MWCLSDGCTGGGGDSGSGGGGSDNSSGGKVRGRFGEAGGDGITNCDGALVMVAVVVVVVVAGMVVGIAAAVAR
jgi:hypothetical protein